MASRVESSFFDPHAMQNRTVFAPPSARGWVPLYVVVLTVATLLPTLCNLQWPATWDGRVFVSLMAISHLGLAALMCCLPGWACLQRRTLRPVAVPLTMALSSAWLLLVLVDSRVYQLFGFHLNGLVLVLLVQGGLLQQLGLPVSAWLAMAVAVTAIVVSQWGAVRLLQSSWVRRWALRPRWLLGILPMLIVSQGMAIWYDANQGGGLCWLRCRGCHGCTPPPRAGR